MQTKKTEILILGGGLSGLAAGHFLAKLMSQSEPKGQILILEKSERLGGAIQSFSEGGYQGELGAHGFLNNSPSSQELLADLGFDADQASSLQQAPLSNFERYICHHGKLEPIPQSPKKILSSKLLPLSAKLRVLGDLFVKPIAEEQSVADWASSRFGPAILPFIDAALTGTYGGDMQRLSIDAVMPGLREKELEHQSVFRALLHRRKHTGDASKPNLTPKPKGLPAMQSFVGGMEQLIQALAPNHQVLYGQEAQTLEKTSDGWLVQCQGYRIEANQLIIALPRPQALPLLDPILAAPSYKVAEAQVYNVLLGFSSKVNIPEAFGYLAPRTEKRYLLGAMFSSQMFPGRAPQGGVLLECLVGGSLHPERLQESDESILQQSLKDVCELLHITEEPIYTKVLRPQASIPQPEVGHQQFLQWRDQLQAAYPDLKIIGFGWEGIGINDMTKMAKAAAEALHQGGHQGAENEIKGVYF